MRWLRILARMAVRLLPEYIVLVLLLGAARAWLFPHIGPDVTSGIGWIVAFAVAGMLFVIPPAGEVPITQAMLALGMGVGPAGALLMTLPPVSVPSFAMLAGSSGYVCWWPSARWSCCVVCSPDLRPSRWGFNEPPPISPVSPRGSGSPTA